MNFRGRHLIFGTSFNFRFRHQKGAPGWQKFCKGTKGLCRNVWIWTKILSPNTRYFVAILRFVKIYGLFGRLVAKNCFFGPKTVFLRQEVQYYMVHILSYKFAITRKKRRICREMGHRLGYLLTFRVKLDSDCSPRRTFILWRQSKVVHVLVGHIWAWVWKFSWRQKNLMLNSDKAWRAVANSLFLELKMSQEKGNQICNVLMNLELNIFLILVEHTKKSQMESHLLARTSMESLSTASSCMAPPLEATLIATSN